MNKINYKLINFAIIIITFFLISKTTPFFIEIIKYLKTIFLPIIISFIIAYVLNIFATQLNKKIKNRTMLILIILLTFITTAFFVIYFTIPVLITQLVSLSKEIIPFMNQLFNKTILIRFPFIEDMVLKNLNNLILSISNNSFNIVIKSLNILTKFFIIVILSIYFLFKMSSIKKYIYKLFKNNNKLVLCLKEIDHSLFNYIKGLFLILIIEMIEYTLIYFLIGHPNFLLLGFLAGITTIVPYFGGLFTNLLALITSLSISKELFILCTIIALFMPIIDNYIIDPKIYHKTTKINPLKVIISIIIFSSIFGFIGLLISIPLYIIIEIVIKNYITLK